MTKTIEDLDDDIYGWTCPVCGLHYDPLAGERDYYLYEADEEDNLMGITGWYAVCNSCMARMDRGDA